MEERFALIEMLSDMDAIDFSQLDEQLQFSTGRKAAIRLQGKALKHLRHTRRIES